MELKFCEGRVVTRLSRNRIPFRYGNACMTECPQAVCEVVIEIDGRRTAGYSGDCLPPRWFDKSPEKDFPQQLEEMQTVTNWGRQGFAERMAQPASFFASWHDVYHQVHKNAGEAGLTPLLASFGVSFWERAIMDAVCRAQEVPFHKAARENLFGIDAGRVHSSMRDMQPGEWLPVEPQREVYVRHTVGLGDPLTTNDLKDNPDMQLDDGLPVTLEQYVAATGLRYLKVKVCNELERDLSRLETIAQIMQQQRESDYQLTLDGNEQYKTAEEFDTLIEAIQQRPALQVLWNNILVVEQPLERQIALEEEHTQGIRELGKHLPVIIDESDGTLDAYPTAIELGYRGVSSKSCKGPIKSLLNAGLTWIANRQNPWQLVMTGEDLCTLGVIPVQSDLCLVATIGLDHVERNGHHFHRGLSYLPEEDQAEALTAHPDFYIQHDGFVGPHLQDGRFRIDSMHEHGFGFAVTPKLDGWEAFVG